jgi:hypothetical protein
MLERQKNFNEVKKWGGFVVTGGKVYHWNTLIIQKDPCTGIDAKRWIGNHRQ